MKAIEFIARLENNSSISIPENIQKELELSDNKDVRVIVLIQENGLPENVQFQTIAADQFLKGYAESDSIYDQD